MNADRSSPLHEPDGTPDLFVRWILLTPEISIRQRIGPGEFTRFVLAVDQLINDCFACSSSDPSSLQLAIAILPGHRTIVAVRGGSDLEQHVSAAADITRRIRAMDAPRVVHAPVVFMRWPVAAAREGKEIPPDRYLAFHDFQTGYNPAWLDQILMRAAGLKIEPSPLYRKVMGTLGFALSVVLPMMKICCRLRSEGLSVIARRSGIGLGGAHTKEIYELESAGPDKFTEIRMPGGGSHFVDEEMLEYMQSEAPQPTQVSLDHMLGSVRRIRVIDGGIMANALLGEQVLLDVADQASIDEFRGLLEIFDGPAGHCRCAGDPALELLDAEGARVGLIGIHHGLSIRSSRWKDDAKLIDGQKLLRWMAVRGVPAPLDQHHSREQEQDESRVEFETWKDTMPECLSSLPDEIWSEVSLEQDLSPLHDALASAYPSPSAQIIRLLEWLAEGSGKWTVIPVYELLPEKLLVRFTVREVIEALESSPPTEAQLEGGAKLLASVAFQQRPPDCEVDLRLVLTQPGLIVCPPHPSLAEIPPEWCGRLLDHCLKSSDPEKIQRARQAFEISQ